MSTARTLALLVGINEYPKLGADSQLRGTLADVAAMEAMVRGRAPNPVVKSLRDGEATRARVLEAWEWLITEATSDDEVLFYWSGHGSRMQDSSEEGHRDERDGWDETLVPHDSGRRDQPNRDIVDDEIRAWLHRLKAKTRHITLIVDACHSGTVARTRVRTVPRDPQPRPNDPKGDGVSMDPGPAPFGLPEGAVLLAACRDPQLALELELGGEHRGIFTWALEQALAELPARFTWEEIFTLAEARVGVGTFGEQIPRIEGARHRRSFLSEH